MTAQLGLRTYPALNSIWSRSTLRVPQNNLLEVFIEGYRTLTKEHCAQMLALPQSLDPEVQIPFYIAEIPYQSAFAHLISHPSRTLNAGSSKKYWIYLFEAICVVSRAASHRLASSASCTCWQIPFGITCMIQILECCNDLGHAWYTSLSVLGSYERDVMSSYQITTSCTSSMS